MDMGAKGHVAITNSYTETFFTSVVPAIMLSLEMIEG
jgi:hypothetical protein